MSDKLKVGVVGCGYWGPNLIRNFKALSDCELKLMCDLNPQRLKHMKSLYPDVEGLMDYDHMLNGAGLDAVIIATSLKTHYEMAKASLLAGKHTFIEKPMAASSQQCAELIEIAEKNKLVLMIGHTFLYSAPIRKIKEIIHWGDIGDIQYISSRRLNLGLFQKDINVAWDLAPHDISIVLYIMDELPKGVNCWGNAHITPGVEDVTTMCLSFPKQKTAIIQSSWLDPRKVREMTIVGTRRPDVFAPHRLAPPPSDARGELRLNPLYVLDSDADPVEYRLRFPSEDYEQEYGACRQYLPDRVTIDRASLAALDAGRLPSGLLDLARRRVIVDLPKNYY